MFHANAVFIVVLLINNILLQCCPSTYAYTQVAVDGSSSSSTGDGPKIYKAVNFDLIFPKSFNSSENVISTTPETIIASPPKTAAVGQAFYPLSQSNERPPYNHQPEAVGEEIPSATIDNDKQQPTLYITPPPPAAYEADSDTQAAAATNEAAVIYERHQNTNGNNYNYNNGPQMVTPNPINIQQQQHQQQQQWQQYEAEQQQQQQLNVNNKAKTIQQQEQQVEQEQQQQNLATGRAVDYQSGYPFGQLITPLIKNTPQPVYRKPVPSYTSYPLKRKTAASSSASSLASGSNVGKIIYPQAMYQRKSPSQAEIDKLRGKAAFKDRFAPSEGVASQAFKTNHDHSFTHNHHNHLSSSSYALTHEKDVSAANNNGNTHMASNSLFSFPPNNINYPYQTEDTQISMPMATMNSYSAPPSGPLKNSKPTAEQINGNVNSISPYFYNPPVTMDYLPPSNEDNEDIKDSYSIHQDPDEDENNKPEDDSLGVLPASAMDLASNHHNNDNIANMMDQMPDNDMLNTMDTMDDDNLMQPHAYETDKEYPTPPPGWLEQQTQSNTDEKAKKPHVTNDHQPHHDIMSSHDHDHEHDHIPYHHSLTSYPSYHSYPHIIYDDEHYHHDHHYHHHPTTTTEPPPPPPEPRVKKYSYFYIGRKLWYIPLYFTVWFTFYVLWLILKSISRHKVNLPNHYVVRRSLMDYDSRKTQKETVNQLAVSVLDKIEKFKRKYSQ